VWVTSVVPTSAPSDRDAPSPKSTVACRIGRLPAATVTVNDTGSPTLGGGPVAPMVTVGARFTRTVTVEVRPPTDAVTCVSRSVVSVVRASPRESLTTARAPRVPASAEKPTGTPGKALPLASVGLAMSVTVPPPAGTVPGLAATAIPVAAAAPIATLAGVALCALPENAETSAMPDCVPARSVTTA